MTCVYKQGLAQLLPVVGTEAEFGEEYRFVPTVPMSRRKEVAGQLLLRNHGIFAIGQVHGVKPTKLPQAMRGRGLCRRYDGVNSSRARRINAAVRSAFKCIGFTSSLPSL